MTADWLVLSYFSFKPNQPGKFMMVEFVELKKLEKPDKSDEPVMLVESD